MNRTLTAAVSMVWEPYGVSEQDIYGEYRYCLNRSYIDMLAEAGVIPRGIIPVHNASHEILLENCDMLILSGGGDPDPSLFRQKDQGSRNPRIKRPGWDMDLYRAARRLDIPVLGICLGMQLVGIVHGASLIQDIDSGVEKHIEHETADRKPLVHRVTMEHGTLLHDILGNSASVSSCHHQVLSRAPEGFSVCAESPDGLIEAIESHDRRVLGVQWHPERDSTGPDIMKRFIEIARIL